eukprot:gene19164-biopygen26683
MLRLVSTTRQQWLSGVYHLVGGMEKNGMPVWTHDAGSTWLYCGPNGKWHFADEGEHVGMNKEFGESIGLICSSEAHGGLLPHAVKGWLTVLEDADDEDDDENAWQGAMLGFPAPAPFINWGMMGGWIPSTPF